MPCKTGLRRQLFISATLYIGQIFLGYSLSWSGPIIPKLQNLEESPLPYLLTETQISLVGSLAYAGSVPGPFLISWFANYKGRKPCFILSGIFAIIAYSILSMSKNLTMLYCGRVLSTLATGMISVNNVVYMGEVAAVNVRGSFLAAFGVFTSLGSILVFSTAPFFPYHISTYIGLALSILFTVTVLFIPESPLFYILKDKEDKAVMNLLKLDRMEEKDNLLETKNEFASTNDKMDWVELFTLRTNRKAFFIVIVINVLQQLSGAMAILFFSGSIFEMAGSSIQSYIAMIIIGLIQLFGSILSPVLVRTTGTRKLLLISTAMCSVTMFLMGLYFYLLFLEVDIINQVKWLPLVILVAFYISYECGFGILPMTLIGEMFTINVRSKGSAVVLSFSWICGFLLTTAFGYSVKSLGAYTVFWFFFFSCACANVFTIFFIPETKGKSLLEIQHFLGKKDNVN